MQLWNPITFPSFQSTIYCHSGSGSLYGLDHGKGPRSSRSTSENRNSSSSSKSSSKSWCSSTWLLSSCSKPLLTKFSGVEFEARRNQRHSRYMITHNPSGMNTASQRNWFSILKEYMNLNTESLLACSWLLSVSKNGGLLWQSHCDPWWMEKAAPWSEGCDSTRVAE